MKIIFTSYSKKHFYLRSQISSFVLLKKAVPFSPFMNFEYNLSGIVNKDLIRIANNTLIDKVDELWVFGPVSDGVLVEVFMAKKRAIPIKYFNLSESVECIKEIKEADVDLEDVSDWVWEWVKSGKNLERWHPRMRFNKKYPLVFPAYSKRNFFWHMHISKFCIENKMIPLNPFMLFKYFLADSVPRKIVYEANSAILKIVNELWVFGEISDGVDDEIKIFNKLEKKIKYFKINDSKKGPSFRKINNMSIAYEKGYNK